MCAPQAYSVLVVEDEWLLRSAIVDLFKERGWLVLEAARGEAAIEIITDEEVDMVVTDVRLAGRLNGWDVADALRRRTPDARVVYASARGEGRSRRVIGSLFFDKPYDPSVVVDACDRLMAQ